MRIKVLKPFVDKITKDEYKPGDIKEFSDERAREILADHRNLAEEVKKKPSKKR